MRSSEKFTGSLYLNELIPRVAEFIADAMFVKQIAVWLRPPASDAFCLAYCLDPVFSGQADQCFLRLKAGLHPLELASIHDVPEAGSDPRSENFPIDNQAALLRLKIKRLILVEEGNKVLAILGVGALLGDRQSCPEDDQLLASFRNQLAHLILAHRLSEELLLAREWESFNRFAAFVLHDLKNLVTLQSMTLENAKQLSNNAEFVADAFATFNHTTDKMINLIASLSVQRGQFSLRQQPVNILQVIDTTLQDLRIQQRNGLKLITSFPARNDAALISGDPELLQKAFTNLLLNAIQSLPKGEGKIELSVSNAENGKITAIIKDSGCGIPPELMTNLFRPFQTTKKNGMGIGLSHTRSIVEVHGGQIRIDSQAGAGTRVKLEFPILSRTQQKGTTPRETQTSSCG